MYGVINFLGIFIFHQDPALLRRFFYFFIYQKRVYISWLERWFSSVGSVENTVFELFTDSVGSSRLETKYFECFVTEIGFDLCTEHDYGVSTITVG